MATVLKEQTQQPTISAPTLAASQPKTRSAGELFINREASLLEFHRRVLEEALDQIQSAARTPQVSLNLQFQPGRVLYDSGLRFEGGT